MKTLYEDGKRTWGWYEAVMVPSSIFWYGPGDKFHRLSFTRDDDQRDTVLVLISMVCFIFAVIMQIRIPICDM